MDETYGICHQAYIPVRAEPSEKAEMVTQLLFGELFTIFGKIRGRSFVQIKISDDGYEGWIDSGTITPLDKESFARYRRTNGTFTLRPAFLAPEGDSGYGLWLSAGSVLYPEQGWIHIGESRYRMPDNALDDGNTDKRQRVASSSVVFMHVPYLWGGKSTFGTDCSGLVQNVFRQAGIMLPRDASRQALTGKTLSFLSEAKPGDLAFFDNEEGTVVHVGIIMENNTIIHASGRVRKDRIDHQGIYSGDVDGLYP